jgi:soluble lytic murein transglycosylase-like protein
MPRPDRVERVSIARKWLAAPREWVCAACLCVAFFHGSAARAQVMEIDAEGTVAVRSGPAVYLTPDLKPVPIRATALPERASRSATPTSSIKDMIAAASARYRISPALVSAVAWRESQFSAAAVSSKGAQGVMQLMPETAKMLHVDASTVSQNIDGGAAYLSILLDHFHGDVIRALAAYDAGPNAVDHYGGIPPYRETRSYVDGILDQMSVVAIGERSQ